MPVTLVVKAPNQKIADMTVECALDWTIRKLKAHLSTVYPSQPVSSTAHVFDKYFYYSVSSSRQREKLCYIKVTRYYSVAGSIGLVSPCWRQFLISSKLNCKNNHDFKKG